MKKAMVVRSGGSIGESKKELDLKGRVIVERCDTLEEAKESARRRNRGLSVGEKSYYKIKYHAISIR